MCLKVLEVLVVFVLDVSVLAMFVLGVLVCLEEM